MKKALIMGTIIAVAAISNAATCKWNVLTADGVKLYAYDSQTQQSSTTELYSGSVTLWAYLFGGNVADKFEVGTLTAANGIIASTTLNTYSDISEGTYTDLSSKYNFILTYEDGDAEFTSGVVQRKTPNILNGTGVAFTNNSISTGTWTTETVPEPTSGLLLLIGVAGLALRRKRA